MFTGESFHTIDSKGRMILPANFRELLGDHFTITHGMDHCLWIYGDEEWKKLAEKISNLPVTDPRARQLSRFFLAGASDCEVDKQGRFLIPQPLRTFAKLEKDVVFSGVGSHIEVWNQEAWNEIISVNLDDYSAELGALGI